MTRARAAVLLAIAAASGSLAAAACFPDYGFGGAPGGADGSTDAQGGDAIQGDDAGDDAPRDSGGDAAGDAAIDVARIDASNMVLLEGGTFWPWDGATQNETLGHSLYVDAVEVSVGRFARWVDAGMPAPCDGGSCAIEPGGPYASVMQWDPAWSASDKVGAIAFKDGTCFDNGTFKPPETFNLSDPSLPINCANWYQALAVCVFEGKRLPTEQEWQLAASSRGTRGTYPWGTAPVDCPHALYDDGTDSGCGFPRPVPAAAQGATAQGLYDVSGDLWEWVWDYGDNAVVPLQGIPDWTGPDSGAYRSVRGGSIFDPPTVLTLDPNTSIYHPDPIQPFLANGFRCVHTAP